MIHYLDCNATTPLDPDVANVVQRFMETDFGNAGSRTHTYGTDAKFAVELAREQIADVVESDASEVIFTSGATESNNLALLGLRQCLIETGKTHIITTAVEHKAVLEPIAEMQRQGFTVSYITPTSEGVVSASQILDQVSDKTGLVSIMHANNETGVINPIQAIADDLIGSEIYFHVDAAQSFGKLLDPLRHPRIDMISVSGHKMYAPKGIGALITRRRRYKRPPLTPLIFGGGQERGLRAGTLPVALIAGMGKAAQQLSENNAAWLEACANTKKQALAAFRTIDHELNGDQNKCMPNVVNISIRHLSSEAAILLLKDIAAVSNGSACTSANYSLSHVLTEMGYEEDRIKSAIRISWCHRTDDVPWDQIVSSLRAAV